jgi:dihydroxyacetone kinase-like protein
MPQPVGALVELLDAAFAGIRERGKADLGQKTLLDALSPAIEELRRQAAVGAPLVGAVAAAAGAAAEGAAATRSMRPQVGRSAWLADRSMGTEDAGAHLVALVFASAARRIAPRPPSAP